MSDYNPYDNKDYGDPYSSYKGNYYDSGDGKTGSIDLNSVVAKSFLYMVGALLITAISAYIVASNQDLMYVLFSSNFYMLILGAELVVVFIAQRMMLSNNLVGSAISFITYSILNGASLSIIFYAFNLGVIAKSFVIAAVVFGLMAVYGHITDKDLTSWGSIGTMLLIGIIVMSLLNAFLFRSSGMEWLISAVTVVVFTGLTAYDVQKIKHMQLFTANSGRSVAVLGMYGALQLYLDFINIFIRLLSLFGNSRD